MTSNEPNVTILPAPLPGSGAVPRVDGRDIAGDVAGHLDYLSRLARDLGVPDPVEEYFAPVIGRWSDMNAEADRWRLVGDAARDVTESLNKPLGRLDAAWDGAAADSFIEYMQKVGLAGRDLSDAMLAIADALDITAEGIREVVFELADLLSETARTASESMVMPLQGDERTRQFLDMVRRPSKELFEAVRQILEAFVQMCDGVDGSQGFQQVRMEHTFPTENWSYEAPSVPTVPVPDTTEAAGTSDFGTGVGAGSGAGGFGGGAGGFGAGAFSGAGAGTGASAGGAAALSTGGAMFAKEPTPAPKPEAPAAAASAGTGRGMGAGMMPMAPMAGGMNQGADGGNHKSRARLVADPSDIVGKLPKASTPVIGDD